jgi:hypothetical protein
MHIRPFAKPSVFGTFIFVLLMWVKLPEKLTGIGVQRVQVPSRKSANILKRI